MKYKVDFINQGYRREFKKHGKEYLRAIEKAASKGDFVLRSEVEKFEQKLAKYVGTKYAVSCNSGTDSLWLALMACGIKPKDEVITVGHTFLASIQAIARCGAKPVLIDVEQDALMNVALIEKAITKKTKAILPVHLSGKVCDMWEIMRIARKYKLKVIEDACQALGASRDGKKAGAWGDVGCFSFISPKLMGAWGDNGALTTNSKKVFEQAQLYRNHWNITQGALHGHQPKAPKSWKGALLSTNTRMDNIQAAILNKKFKYLPWILKRREQICDRYYRELESLESPEFILPTRQQDQVWQEFIVLVNDKKPFIEHMLKRKIELLIRDTTPNHKLPGLGLDKYKLPMTDWMADKAVRLPTYPYLTDGEVGYVIKAIKDYIGLVIEQ